MKITVGNPSVYPDWAAFPFFPFEVPQEFHSNEIPPYNFGDYMLKRDLQIKAVWQLAIALIMARFLLKG